MTSHIKSMHDDATAVCGAPLTNEFHFKSVDAAVLNGMHEKKPVTCLYCIDHVVKFLLAGSEACLETK